MPEEEVVNALLEALEKRKSPYPMYLARDSDQMENELRSRGLLARPEEGLQDDLDNAFRMFTLVNEQGGLVGGLVGIGHAGPAHLMELYQTMDLRGLIWNYGVGYLSALKGGWNRAIDAAEKEATANVIELRKEREKEKKETLEFLKNELEIRKIDYEMNPKVAEFYRPQRDRRGRVIIDRQTGVPKQELVGRVVSTFPIYSPFGYGSGLSCEYFSEIPLKEHEIDTITKTKKIVKFRKRND